MIKSFEDFLGESENVKIDKDLREYTLTHKSGSIFEVRSGDFYRQIDVAPYKSETIESLKAVHEKLSTAIETLNVNLLYQAVNKAEMIPYSYGNVFTSKFDLRNVADLSMELEDEQAEVLQKSIPEFLLNVFSQLNKNTKDLVISELRERAEVLCVVIEALFYYIRTVDTDNFYNGMSSDEILEKYKEEVLKASKEAHFSYEGPFSSYTRGEIVKDTKTAVWICKKDMKEFYITATINPKDLKSEANIGEKGLKFSISLENGAVEEKDFNYFDLVELPSRVELFDKKILKKRESSN